MDRYLQMQVFVAVAEEQGFAAAARRLHMSAPAVTRAVAALEERLGVKLLTRTTRHVRTTEAGLRYLEDSRRILSDVTQADEAAVGINATPRGHLAVTAPVLFGRLYVLPGVVKYLQAYPDMEVEAVFLDRVVNLLEEGFDIAVRIGELPDSSMRAVRVGEVQRVTVASPEYIARYGVPEKPQDLQAHTLIAFSGGSYGAGWQYDDGPSVRVRSRLMVSANDSVIEAAKLGYGISRALSYQVVQAIADGQLVRVLTSYEQTVLPVHLVHREGRHASVKVRTFIDLLAEHLRVSLGEAAFDV